MLTNEWSNKFPNEAGIYALFKKSKLIYVGETSSIKGRMNYLRRTENHTVRRSIGNKIFSKVKGFKKVNNKTKFPDHIEARIDEYMKKLDVAVLPMNFGRKETEEHIIREYSPIFNFKDK